MKNKKSNTALKMRKRRRLGAFIFVVVLLALAVVAVRIYNMDKPSRDAELLTLVNPWNTIPDGYEPQLCTLAQSVTDAQVLGCSITFTGLCKACQQAAKEAASE